ncbi:MAG TPA: PEP-CTERM sorting domain-containing protein [Fimbriimonadaceae bacterium]|nr:PEP-CTERM sorting domain-containing protein [Fimbriimonadaceae bacterium]
MRIYSTLAFALLTTFAVAQRSYVTNGSVLSENFDGLPTSSSFLNLDGTWSDNTTLPGWYRVMTSDGTPGVENRWRVDDGNAPGGSLYSYGSFGSSDRALGFVTSTNLPRIDVGLALRNDTGGTLTGFSLRFVGEQWRHGTSGAQSLDFSFGIGNASLSSGLYTRVGALDFHAPQVSGTNSGLNGNFATNRRVIQGSINGFAWNPNEVMWLRWTGTDHPAGDHGLALDNLEFMAVPEPGGVATLGLGVVCLIRRKRKV